jgi:hypothetical protein
MAQCSVRSAELQLCAVHLAMFAAELELSAPPLLIHYRQVAFVLGNFCETWQSVIVTRVRDFSYHTYAQ